MSKAITHTHTHSVCVCMCVCVVEAQTRKPIGSWLTHTQSKREKRVVKRNGWLAGGRASVPCLFSLFSSLSPIQTSFFFSFFILPQTLGERAL